MSHDTKDPHRTGTGEEGHPIPGAEAMGFSEATGEGPGVVRTSTAVRDEVEPVTGHLDDSVSRPSHDHLNRTVSPEALDAARSHPLFAPDDRPITGHLDEAAPAKPVKDAKP
ncbi:MAG TPA: hypothetical protein VLQ45_18015 [Thermoanaerobaculia bacterium]|nr:hypothetical protein [Thermoanaerobaculia bacterium]